jgi:hypothetical protein
LCFILRARKRDVSSGNGQLIVAFGTSELKYTTQHIAIYHNSSSRLDDRMQKDTSGRHTCYHLYKLVLAADLGHLASKETPATIVLSKHFIHNYLKSRLLLAQLWLTDFNSHHGSPCNSEQSMAGCQLIRQPSQPRLGTPSSQGSCTPASRAHSGCSNRRSIYR